MRPITVEIDKNDDGYFVSVNGYDMFGIGTTKDEAYAEFVAQMGDLYLELTQTPLKQLSYKLQEQRRHLDELFKTVFILGDE